MSHRDFQRARDREAGWAVARSKAEDKAARRRARIGTRQLCAGCRHYFTPTQPHHQLCLTCARRRFGPDPFAGSENWPTTHITKSKTKVRAQMLYAARQSEKAARAARRGGGGNGNPKRQRGT